jgi:hypothetical protein
MYGKRTMANKNTCDNRKVILIFCIIRKLLNYTAKLLNIENYFPGNFLIINKNKFVLFESRQKQKGKKREGERREEGEEGGKKKEKKTN